jgi:dolichol-phosphate mannosyltransferase
MLIDADIKFAKISFNSKVNTKKLRIDMSVTVLINPMQKKRNSLKPHTFFNTFIVDKIPLYYYHVTMSNQKNGDIKLAIVTPTYNEAKNIPILVKKLKKYIKNIKGIFFTLIIVDDNSPDGTGNIADLLSKTEKMSNFNIEVLHRKQKNGLGKAYIDSFKILLDKNYDYILQMDADLSHNPKYINNFVKEIKQDRDFVVASRYIPGGGTPDWGLFRKFLSKSGNLYTRLLLGNTITDYTGGYNLFSTKLLRKLDFDKLQTSGYGFLIELKYNALKHCHSAKQFPIVFLDRRHGKSKIPKNTIINNLLLVIKIRYKK